MPSFEKAVFVGDNVDFARTSFLEIGIFFTE
jgi:hypothetical protein